MDAGFRRTRRLDFALMVSKRRNDRPFRRAVWQGAIALALAAWMAVGMLPLAEARLGPDSDGHVETGGTKLHHAHNEATCPACLASHLAGSSEPGRRAPAAFPETAALRISPPEVSIPGVLSPAGNSRAPPRTRSDSRAS